MATTNCDHCLTEIKPTNLNSSNIYWCLNCLMDGGRELLKSYGIKLAHDDQFYKNLGHTAWSSGTTSGDKVSLIPRINLIAAVVEPSISIDLETIQDEVKLAEVCKLKYYGIGICSCGACPKRHVLQSRNVFRY